MRCFWGNLRAKKAETNRFVVRFSICRLLRPYEGYHFRKERAEPEEKAAFHAEAARQDPAAQEVSARPGKKRAGAVGTSCAGTKIEVGLVDPLNRIAARRRMPTRSIEGPQMVVERIAQAVDELAGQLPAGEKIAALGICSLGRRIKRPAR
jgi:hypothetical protein